MSRYYGVFIGSLNEKRRDTCSAHTANFHNATQSLQLIVDIKYNTGRQEYRIHDG